MKKKIIVSACLAITVAFAVIFGVTLKRIISSEKGQLSSSSHSESDSSADSSSKVADINNENTNNVSSSQNTKDETTPSFDDEKTTPATDNTAPPEPPESRTESLPHESSTPPDTDKVPDSFFAHSLFIGDSRTVGLRDYAKMNDACFFADTGMSVYNVQKKSVNVPGIGNTNLKSLLAAYKYQKIYLMLGINELGYPNMDNAVKKYGELIELVKNAQPDAVIIIEANLHVTEKISSTHDYFTNNNINTLNKKLSEFADNKRIFYIDVNPIFDDSKGNLDEKYTKNDDFHPIGKYYETWGKWIASATLAS